MGIGCVVRLFGELLIGSLKTAYGLGDHLDPCRVHIRRGARKALRVTGRTSPWPRRIGELWGSDAVLGMMNRAEDTASGRRGRISWARAVGAGVVNADRRLGIQCHAGGCTPLRHAARRVIRMPFFDNETLSRVRWARPPDHAGEIDRQWTYPLSPNDDDTQPIR